MVPSKTSAVISIWLGNIKFQKLELKREFFLLMDLDLDVEGSMIEEVDLIIPWKALQTEVHIPFVPSR